MPERRAAKRATAAKWRDEEVRRLLAGLLDAKGRGFTSENGFKSTIWISISATFDDPLKQTNRCCESKWTRLKSDYRSVKFLRDLSGFGWDSSRYLVTAEPEVWDELAKKHPEKIKWRTTPFPWFDDILDILGESLAPGRYSFPGGSNIETDDDHENPVNLEESREPTNTSLTRLSTPAETSNSHCLETQSQRRARESGPLAAKRRKASKTGVMEKLGEGITAMARAVEQMSKSQSKDSVDSTLQGQAQLQVQTETCLTEAGQLVMLERFTDLALARTYLSIKSETLRVKFLKKQVAKENCDYFID